MSATTIVVSDVRPHLVDTINPVALRAMYAPAWTKTKSA